MATDPTPDERLVTQLLREQSPSLAGLPVRAAASQGSSNWVFRLGEDLAVRLPRTDDYVADLQNELAWLPTLAPHLSHAVPGIVFAGSPSEEFTRPWSVVSWVPGRPAADLDKRQQERLADGLGAFTRSLHAVDTQGLPAGPERWGYRCGEPVTDERDHWLEVAADRLADTFDPDAVRLAWQRLRDVPAQSQPASWVHTDLSAENVLVDDAGALTGVIDFGGIGIGDPAVDLLYAWSLFDPPARDRFRRAADADDATWARARAWGFVGPGLLTLANYRATMPGRTRALTRMVTAIAADVGISLRPSGGPAGGGDR